MKRGKRVKPEVPVEYILLVTPHVNERTKEKVTLIALRTVNEFTAFRYDLVVNPSFDGKRITLEIQGLRAPGLTLPATGPAEFTVERGDLRGSYEIILSKHGKVRDIYNVEVGANAVKILHVPDTRFSDIVNTREGYRS